MKISAVISFFVLILFFSCSKSNNNNSNQQKNSVAVQSVSQNRADTSTTFRFYVTLSATATSQASVNFTTADGTAKSGKDYVAQSGTLVFQTGQQQQYVDVKVNGDSLRQSSQVFYVQLSNPQNCSIGTAQGSGQIINDGTYLPTDTSGYVSQSSYAGYNLAWSDEFNGKSINTNDWNFETGGNGWGNHELENYTSRVQNAFLSSGHLVIEARQENYQGSSYTSARMTTQNKQQFQYGRIDIRAKLPVSTGMWPALWMLGTNISQIGWPGCGETDIMELIGKNPNQVVGSFHWQITGGAVGTVNNSYTLASQDFSQQFHVFSLIWEKDSMQILIDDQVYVSGNTQNINGGAYPFNATSFFIFNVAVGGDWPGSPDNMTVFPQRMFVDYVRVFQK